MTETSNTNTEQLARLRAAADLLEQHPDLPAPMITAYSSGKVDIDWFVTRGEGQREAMNHIRRTLGGHWGKGASDQYFRLERERDGLQLCITADREQVCERVVVGTETVTIPAVEARDERTEVRGVVEWRCEPVTEAVSR